MTTDVDVPEHLVKWLTDLPKAERGPEIDRIAADYTAALRSDLFMREEEIADLSKDLLEKEFKKGHFRKMMSKRMRQKMNGKIILHHSHRRQTAVFTEIYCENRKRIGYTYSVVNYFKTPSGYIYVLRLGICYPQIYVFTGHFFDRLLQRGLNNHDHAARMSAVFRLLRHIDRRSVDGSLAVFSCAPSETAFLAVLGGLCLGSLAIYKDLPRELDFNDGIIRSTNPKSMEKPEQRQIFLFLTYVDEGMLGPEQKDLYKLLLTAKQPVKEE